MHIILILDFLKIPIHLKFNQLILFLPLFSFVLQRSYDAKPQISKSQTVSLATHLDRKAEKQQNHHLFSCNITARCLIRKHPINEIRENRF